MWSRLQQSSQDMGRIQQSVRLVVSPGKRSTGNKMNATFRHLPFEPIVSTLLASCSRFMEGCCRGMYWSTVGSTCPRVHPTRLYARKLQKRVSDSNHPKKMYQSQLEHCGSQSRFKKNGCCSRAMLICNLGAGSTRQQRLLA